MKILRQKSFAGSCTHRPLQKTFMESLIATSLKSMFEQRHLELSYKKFCGQTIPLIFLLSRSEFSKELWNYLDNARHDSNSCMQTI